MALSGARLGLQWLPDLICLTLILALLVLSPLKGMAADPQMPDEQRLYERIMNDYVLTVKPVVADDLPLQVLFSIRLKQIVDLDERQQVLTTNVFIDQTWIDSALAWNVSEFRDVTSLRIPADQIWKPDTFIYNNADNGSTGFISGKFIQIHHNGAVTWPVTVRLRSSCEVKIAYFPFDYQKCLVKFGSWIYSHRFVDYTIRPNAVSVDLTTYINNSEWELLSMTMEKTFSQRSQSLVRHPFLTMTLHLRRNTFFYLFNIIVPCIMLSVLTLVTFWLPPTSGEKVTLGLSVFLAFSMFMLLIADEVPASSDAVPLIGIYLMVVMTMTSLSVILAVLVINLYHRGIKLRPAPRWTARLFIELLAIPLGVSRDVQLLATTIALPDHCRFFLIHNKFDFPNYDINAYIKYSESQTILKDNLPSPGRNSCIVPSDEDQQYVFDHHNAQNRYGYRRYTSGKRQLPYQSDRQIVTNSQKKSIHKTRAEYMNDRCGNYEDSEDICDLDADGDMGAAKTGHYSYRSLLHLCDKRSSSSGKVWSPFRNRMQQTHAKESNLSHAARKGNHHSVSDSHVCEGNRGRIQLVPAGTNMNKRFPFLEQGPSSFFGVETGHLKSPTQRRRQLINTVKHFNEKKENVQPSSYVHSTNIVTPLSLLRNDSCSSSDFSHMCNDVSKLQRSHSENCNITDTVPQYFLTDFETDKNSAQSERHYYSMQTISRKEGSNNQCCASNCSSTRILSRIEPAFKTRSINQLSQDSLHTLYTLNSYSVSSSYDNLPEKTCQKSFSPVNKSHPSPCHQNYNHNNATQTRHSDFARLETLSGRIDMVVPDETFCECSDSQGDIWLPYDVNENTPPQDLCLRGDFQRHDGDFSLHANRIRNYILPTDPLLNVNGRDTDNVLVNHNLSTSAFRAKQNFLKQQYAEQFLDDRSKLILAKARLLVAEWQTIAAVMDRVLFLLASLATVFAYVFILVIVPNEQKLNTANISQTLPATDGKYHWDGV